MRDNRFRRFLSLYKICTGILCLLSGLCLASGCFYICFFGDKTFSGDAVTEVFSFLAFPLSVTILAVIGGLVLHLLCPEKTDAETNGCTPRGTAPTSRQLTLLRLTLLAAGALLLLAGLLSGGTADVLTKAVNICSECIGLG